MLTVFNRHDTIASRCINKGIKMRTTLTLDDNIAKSLQEQAHKNRQPFKEVVNQALKLGLTLMATPVKPVDYVLNPSRWGVRPGMDLIKSSNLAAQLEDEAPVAKLEMRK